jgi:hypothetical protein
MDLRQVIAEATKQGWRVQQSTAGYMLYPPDRSLGPVAVHRTPSDQRAVRNFKAEMTKRGFCWPGGV